MKVLWNEKIVEESEVKIDLEDRGYQFGDGIYEVIRIYDGYLYMEKEHLDRLWVSAEKIRMTLPFTKEELSQRLHRLANEVGLENARIYFQVTRGTAKPRLHNFPDPKEVQPVLMADIQPASRPSSKQNIGIRAGFVEDKRWLHCDIKSISLLGNILALDEAQQKGYDEAVLVRDGYVTEASASNLWMVKDEVLYTHPDGNLVLPGIAKIKIRELVKTLGIELREERFTKEELLAADECFKTSSVAEIMPIIEIDDHKIGEGMPGSLTKKILTAYIETVNLSVQAHRDEK
ncbi:D-amino-acid transaminase [Enterococcus malodoratus]|uniref:D-alanine aminotransferase n=1 Tax=Enterococcus malodoratus ATCC 43197 TaxID=1158601 RepID=R2RYQ7_9ENTE|nr:D-amino-acid transaminase [Enterococcus malodoratus]EOH81004.1 D-amino-acid transaminase [Enterococcus malodoratus ATCC 43197]EOT69514.1 D-amino-acid transaminase [Enterococcus malodoratus ATCC 43197]OJG65245.1 D-amino-acid transaminase [Enterococcus malodoratus]SPX01155.1 D-amino-acid transaminase [Enterococcus malodoratus]STC71132.1 D-amino-acid transaminase [Enterococcus malodoratus]